MAGQNLVGALNNSRMRGTTTTQNLPVGRYWDEANQEYRFREAPESNIGVTQQAAQQAALQQYLSNQGVTQNAGEYKGPDAERYIGSALKDFGKTSINPDLPVDYNAMLEAFKPQYYLQPQTQEARPPVEYTFGEGDNAFNFNGDPRLLNAFQEHLYNQGVQNSGYTPPPPRDASYMGMFNNAGPSMMVKTGPSMYGMQTKQTPFFGGTPQPMPNLYGMQTQQTPFTGGGLSGLIGNQISGGYNGNMFNKGGMQPYGQVTGMAGGKGAGTGGLSPYGTPFTAGTYSPPAPTQPQNPYAFGNFSIPYGSFPF